MDSEAPPFKPNASKPVLPPGSQTSCEGVVSQPLPGDPPTSRESGWAPPLVELKGIVKRFPGVTALDGVDFDLRPGEVHVVFGENGSGKSTLVHLIAGVHRWNEGYFLRDGRLITHLTPHDARTSGISAVFQEFSLVPGLTVEENIFLGRERASLGFLRKREMRATAKKILQELGFELNPKAHVCDLSRADRQMTEIAKALLQEAKILILDEPTASLTERETSRLFGIVEQLRSRGVGIIYVSHRLAEIRKLGDRITVLRDGMKIATVQAREVDDVQLVEMMTGRKIGMMYPQVDHSPRVDVLETRDLTVSGRVEGVSIHLREGEITGIAGLAGHGKSEIARAIFGLAKISGGQIVLQGETIHRPTPANMLARGVVYFPSDRAMEGLAPGRPMRENASMAALDLPTFSFHKILRRRRERTAVGAIVEALAIRPPRMERPVKFFSGGNQQKVVLSRGLTRHAKVFLFDDPTVGVDVGAKKEIYTFLKQLTERGAAVLFISSELPELLNLCHRLYVAYRGRIVAEFTGEGITERNVLRTFFQQIDGPQGPPREVSEAQRGAGDG
jgi:ribose transport system ATP-binding protein